MKREKYQEALDSLKDTKCDEINNCKQCSLTNYCGHYQCIKTLQELVDKATPKKTIKEHIIRDGYRQYKNYCPICKQELLILGNYCLHCGQAVDWSDE